MRSISELRNRRLAGRDNWRTVENASRYFTGAPRHIKSRRSRVSSFLMTFMALTLGLVMPSWLDAQVCSGSRGDEVDLSGTVRTRSGAVPLPGAGIQGVLANRTDTLSTAADRSGAWTLCVPAGQRVELHAKLGPHESSAVTIRSDAPKPGIVLEIAVPEGSTAISSTTRVSDGWTRAIGRVTDRETHEGVADVVVSIPESQRSALTDEEGRFTLSSVEPGRQVVRISHVRYGEVVEEVDIAAGSTTVLEVELAPEAIEVEPLIVTTVRTPRLERAGFYERREWGEKIGLGTFLDEEDIRRRGSLRLTHALQMLPGTKLRRRCPRGHCFNEVVFGDAKRLKSTGSGIEVVPCSADVYINGARTRMYFEGLDDLVSLSEIAAVEVYRRASELPARFGGATDGCGAIVIWTK